MYGRAFGARLAPALPSSLSPLLPLPGAGAVFSVLGRRGRSYEVFQACGHAIGCGLDGSGQDGRQVRLAVGVEALVANVAVEVDGQHGDAQDRLLYPHLGQTEKSMLDEEA